MGVKGCNWRQRWGKEVERWAVAGLLREVRGGAGKQGGPWGRGKGRGLSEGRGRCEGQGCGGGRVPRGWGGGGGPVMREWGRVEGRARCAHLAQSHPLAPPAARNPG